MRKGRKAFRELTTHGEAAGDFLHAEGAQTFLRDLCATFASFALNLD